MSDMSPFRVTLNPFQLAECSLRRSRLMPNIAILLLSLQAGAIFSSLVTSMNEPFRDLAQYFCRYLLTVAWAAAILAAASIAWVKCIFGPSCQRDKEKLQAIQLVLLAPLCLFFPSLLWSVSHLILCSSNSSFQFYAMASKPVISNLRLVLFLGSPWWLLLGILFILVNAYRAEIQLPHIRRTLRQSRCAECGYCILYLEVARCPECGTYFDKRDVESGASID